MTGRIRAERLFFGTCFALVPTAASFAIVGDILGALKAQFVLTNYQVGLVGGAALWGMAISQILLGSLADFGLRRMMRLAFACHLLGVGTMISATFTAGSEAAFWVLFAGAITLGLGNGFVEVAGNPLVAALFPEQKVTRLNQFHGWFPGGMVIAGLASFLMSLTPLAAWEFRLGLTFIPILVYGFLILREPFPETEGVRAGVRFGEMFRATFTSPLFLVMFFCMMITASLEMGPMRWIPAVLQAGGIPGILVLVWTSGLMAVLRFRAGPLVERLSPTGLLLCSAILSGAGLYLLSLGEQIVTVFGIATLYAVGIAFFWPTMLGFVNERIPRSGALGMGLMGGVGMAITGLVTIPLMGDIADRHLPERLPAQETTALLGRAETALEIALDGAPAGRRGDVLQALELTRGALEAETTGTGTANALRAVIGSGLVHPVVEEAGLLLAPAENHGGRVAFRYVAPLALVITLIFGYLFLRDRRGGGYRAERLEKSAAAEGAPIPVAPLVALLLGSAALSACGGGGTVAAAADPAPPRIVILGGGSSHDFARWFQQADSATLAGTGARVRYSADPATAAPLVAEADVLVQTANQPFPDADLRQRILQHVASGKGLVVVHAGAWYNWEDWPEYNRQLVSGGARAHRRYGEFTVQVTDPAHPVMAGVPASFTLADELYRFRPDADGPEIHVLATAREVETGREYPIVWTVAGADGRIVVNTLGHDGAAHEHPAYRRILTNAVQWARGGS